MRRKFALLTTAALATVALTVGGAAPAYATHCENIQTDDPVIIYSCRVVDAAPDLKPTISHYYTLAWSLIDTVYCTASPNC